MLDQGISKRGILAFLSSRIGGSLSNLVKVVNMIAMGSFLGSNGTLKLGGCKSCIERQLEVDDV